MRMDGATLEAIRKRIAPLDTEETRQAYREGRFPRAGIVLDLDKRYRWDLFYLSRSHKALPDDHGLYDRHIDTALKSIVPPL